MTIAADVALLYASDISSAHPEDPRVQRLIPLVTELRQHRVAADTVVWHDELADDVAEQLRGITVVLVWCNPFENGVGRERLDDLLETLSDDGALVSAHPEAIRRVGTKDVLFDTRALPFGSAVARIDRADQIGDELLERLGHGPRVLKQQRGQSGSGVWRVELTDDGTLLVRHAARGSVDERIDVAAWRDRLRPYFESGGRLVDQPWQPRIREGMVRAYLVGTNVVGFGHQAVNALHPDIADPGPRLYHGPDEPAFRSLRHSLESGWVTMLCEAVGLTADRVPLLWDLDFMLGEPRDGNPEGHVLCEINASSVAPFPPSAIHPLAAAVHRLLHE